MKFLIIFFTTYITWVILVYTIKKIKDKDLINVIYFMAGSFSVNLSYLIITNLLQ